MVRGSFLLVNASRKIGYNFSAREQCAYPRFSRTTGLMEYEKRESEGLAEHGDEGNAFFGYHQVQTANARIKHAANADADIVFHIGM